MATTGTGGRPDIDLPTPVPPQLPDDPVGVWPELRRVGTRLPLRDYLRELWRRREFAVTVPMGELRAQNQDTALGQLWQLLNPLFLIGVYYLIFGVILQVETRRGVDDYLPFLIVGVITYNFTRSSMQTSARMFVKNRKLVRSINFPRAILPFSAMVSETVSYLYALPVMAVLLVASGVRPSPAWLLVVPILVVHVAFNLGITMATARLSFHFRDVQQFLPYLLRLWLYVSGVLIPINADLIPQDTLRRILQANPMYSIIEMSREAFLDGAIRSWVWVAGPAWALLALVVGFWFFRRAEQEYGRV